MVSMLVSEVAMRAVLMVAVIVVGCGGVDCPDEAGTYRETSVRVGGDCPSEWLPMMTEGAMLTGDGCWVDAQRSGYVGECRYESTEQGDERVVRWECPGEAACVAVYRLTRERLE